MTFWNFIVTILIIITIFEGIEVCIKAWKNK